MAAHAGAPPCADRISRAIDLARTGYSADESGDCLALGDVGDDLAAGRAALIAACRAAAPRNGVAARCGHRVSAADGRGIAIHRGLDLSRGPNQLRDALPAAR